MLYICWSLAKCENINTNVVKIDAAKAGGELATVIKTVYKTGGPAAKEMVIALVDLVKTKGARQAFSVLQDSAGFMLKAVIKGNLAVLKDSLQLAKEGGGTALEALNRFATSYKQFDTLFPFPKLANAALLKVSKYGMYAVETAKAMGKCGNECIGGAGKAVDNLRRLGKSSIQAMQELEDALTEARRLGADRLDWFQLQGEYAKYFDSKLNPMYISQYLVCLANNTLNKLAYTGPKGCSKKLARNMVAKYGVRPPGHAAHHLVGGNIVDVRKCIDPLAPIVNVCDAARDLMSLGGINDINVVENGVYLPITSTIAGSSKAIPHVNIHTREYFIAVNDRLKLLGITGPGDRPKLVAELDKIRTEVLLGTFRY